MDDGNKKKTGASLSKTSSVSRISERHIKNGGGKHSEIYDLKGFLQFNSSMGVSKISDKNVVDQS